MDRLDDLMQFRLDWETECGDEAERSQFRSILLGNLETYIAAGELPTVEQYKAAVMAASAALHSARSPRPPQPTLRQQKHHVRPLGEERN